MQTRKRSGVRSTTKAGWPPAFESAVERVEQDCREVLLFLEGVEEATKAGSKIAVVFSHMGASWGTVGWIERI